MTWWRFVLASRTSTEEAADQLAVLDAHAATLAADGDVEVLPTLQALVPYALLCRGRAAEALARVRRDVPASTTTGAASFPLWVRAEVLAGQGRPDRDGPTTRWSPSVTTPTRCRGTAGPCGRACSRPRAAGSPRRA